MKALGRTVEISDTLDPARAAAMKATLDLAGPVPEARDPLPPFWHYAYFWEPQRPADLGRDGHPRTGDFIPNLGLPRRMWAGGALEFHTPIRLGEPAVKRTTITDVQEKDARSGKLAVVTLDHKITQWGELCLSETQSLLYREEAAPDAPKPVPPVAPTDETVSQSRKFSPTDLFRYSALTFNGHRIHYDRDYAMQVEGYAGLVVHGPILAQMLVNLAQGMLGELSRFSFRATAPLFDFEEATFCARPEGDNGLALWVRGSDGRMCMSAKAG
ncbi:FAS1-like dehydratase domain-containing protein [Neptunicoccus cionae]|uniref:FAS1-like dehydratase domain-containing protein n=1 Tax=Neptunicoccus cionae TaxID=2035344 RepID=UPI000C7671DD|nr:MaoC family dehydratase N-terminal domain-containing protein [Amylibacter cionae]PLS20031.1 acyl dehydratase [Amylibacter cionae]